MDRQKVAYKVGDLVEVIASPLTNLAKPKLGLIVGSLNDRAFKVWVMSGHFESRLDTHLKLVSSV